MNKYTFFEDPGHGWLQVPIAELQALGIAGQISSYSYRRGEFAYLEEDCDYSRFVEARKAAGNPLQRENIATVYQENTPIRGYACFNQRKAAA